MEPNIPKRVKRILVRRPSINDAQSTEQATPIGVQSLLVGARGFKPPTTYHSRQQLSRERAAFLERARALKQKRESEKISAELVRTDKQRDYYFSMTIEQLEWLWSSRDSELDEEQQIQVKAALKNKRGFN